MSQPIATNGPYVARTAEDLTQMLLDYWTMMGTGVTDLSVGSVIRTELEALAQLAEQFYVDQASQLQDAIAQSAYTAFNFTPLPAKEANGYLVFHVTPGLSAATIITAGTLWQPSGQSVTYATSSTFTIPAATAGYWHVPAKCLVLGSIGNLAGGATGNLQYAVTGVTVYVEDGATHTGDVVVTGATPPLPSGMNYGVDAETPAEMRARFASFLSNLHRSTIDSLAYGASTAVILNPDGTTAELVALSRAIDKFVDSTLVTTDGIANVYVHNGIGSPGGHLTSTALIAAAQNIVNGSTTSGIYTPGYKGAGIPATVFAASEYLATLSITVTAVGSGTATAMSSVFLSAASQEAVQNYFAGLKIGDKFWLSALLTAIGSVPGVQASAVTALSVVRQSDSVVMTTSVADWAPPSNGLVMLQLATITVA